MTAAAHTEFVGSDWMTCRCILGQDHTREQYEAFYAEEFRTNEGEKTNG